jgi:hypothetical protein
LLFDLAERGGERFLAVVFHLRDSWRSWHAQLSHNPLAAAPLVRCYFSLFSGLSRMFHTQ